MNVLQQMSPWMLALIFLATILAGPVPGYATLILGNAESFAVLGASTVTNTGATVINGDLGVYPGTAITGFLPGIVNGSVYSAGAFAGQAQNDLTKAYNGLAGMTDTLNLSPQDLGGLTLTSGVYQFDSTAQLTNTLTLDAGGFSNAYWVFQIGSTLTTASGSKIHVINGGSTAGIFWQVGSSATLGTGTAFIGNILADQSITLNSGATIFGGSALALHAAVTLDSNTISRGYSGGLEFNSGGAIVPAPDTNQPVPEPATLLLLCTGMAGLAGAVHRRKTRSMRP